MERRTTNRASGPTVLYTALAVFDSTHKHSALNVSNTQTFCTQREVSSRRGHYRGYAINPLIVALVSFARKPDHRDRLRLRVASSGCQVSRHHTVPVLQTSFTSVVHLLFLDHGRQPVKILALPFLRQGAPRPADVVFWPYCCTAVSAAVVSGACTSSINSAAQARTSPSADLYPRAPTNFFTHFVLQHFSVRRRPATRVAGL